MVGEYLRGLSMKLQLAVHDDLRKLDCHDKLLIQTGQSHSES